MNSSSDNKKSRTISSSRRRSHNARERSPRCAQDSEGTRPEDSNDSASTEAHGLLSPIRDRHECSCCLLLLLVSVLLFWFVFVCLFSSSSSSSSFTSFPRKARNVYLIDDHYHTESHPISMQANRPLVTCRLIPEAWVSHRSINSLYFKK